MSGVHQLRGVTRLTVWCQSGCGPSSCSAFPCSSVFSQHSYGKPSQDSVNYPVLFQWIPLYLNSFLLFATKNSHGEQDFFFFLLMVCNILVIWCEQLTHWKSPWCWERLRAEGKEGVRGWDGWMASSIQRTWIWANFRRWWGTERPGMLQSMGSQRVRHD